MSTFPANFVSQAVPSSEANNIYLGFGSNNYTVLSPDIIGSAQDIPNTDFIFDNGANNDYSNINIFSPSFRRFEDLFVSVVLDLSPSSSKLISNPDLLTFAPESALLTARLTGTIEPVPIIDYFEGIAIYDIDNALPEIESIEYLGSPASIIDDPIDIAKPANLELTTDGNNLFFNTSAVAPSGTSQDELKFTFDTLERYQWKINFKSSSPSANDDFTAVTPNPERSGSESIEAEGVKKFSAGLEVPIDLDLSLNLDSNFARTSFSPLQESELLFKLEGVANSSDANAEDLAVSTGDNISTILANTEVTWLYGGVQNGVAQIIDGGKVFVEDTPNVFDPEIMQNSLRIDIDANDITLEYDRLGEVLTPDIRESFRNSGWSFLGVAIFDTEDTVLPIKSVELVNGINSTNPDYNNDVWRGNALWGTQAVSRPNIIGFDLLGTDKDLQEAQPSFANGEEFGNGQWRIGVEYEVPVPDFPPEGIEEDSLDVLTGQEINKGIKGVSFFRRESSKNKDKLTNIGMDDKGDYWLGIHNSIADERVSKGRYAWIVTERRTSIVDALVSGEYAASDSFKVKDKSQTTYAFIDSTVIDALDEVLGEGARYRANLYDLKAETVVLSRGLGTLEKQVSVRNDDLINSFISPSEVLI
jgi:hypothetical protein